MGRRTKKGRPRRTGSRKAISQEQAYEIILRVAEEMSTNSKYHFGCYDADDIRQEAFILGMQLLEKWDRKRPLENLLRVHLHNRLLNLKRNNVGKHTPPCTKCPTFLDENSTHPVFCNEKCKERYKKWQKRYQTKTSLSQPGSLNETSVPDSYDDMHGIELRDMDQYIRSHLPPLLLNDYLRLRNGVPLTTMRRRVLRTKILEVLQWQKHEVEI